MVDSINCSEQEKYELVHGALKLFAEVDINGDHHMEWDEFMVIFYLDYPKYIFFIFLKTMNTYDYSNTLLML